MAVQFLLRETERGRGGREIEGKARGDARKRKYRERERERE